VEFLASGASEDASVVGVLVIVPTKGILVRLRYIIIWDELSGKLTVELKLGEEFGAILFTLFLQLLLFVIGFATPLVH
jgi:hypothetical protein